MLPHSWQPCAVAPAVRCCSPSPAVLTALLPPPSPPCHSWYRATKWPLNSSARGEPHSLLQRDHSLSNSEQNYHARNQYDPWGSEKVLSCVKGEDCTAESHTTGAWEEGPGLPQQDQARWKVVFCDSNGETTKAQAASTNTYQKVLMAW